MAAAAIMDRADALLQGLVSDARRALSSPLVKLHDAAETPESWYPAADPSVALGYLLAEDGDSGNPRSMETSTGIRDLALRLDLIAYNGGEEAVTQKRQALERTLMTAWEQVRPLLQDPNNLDRATTGWWMSSRFSAGAPVVKGDRLVKTCRLVVTYRLTLGAL